MTNPSIDSLKNEVADCYIKNFQKELWWLQWIMILPLKSWMKNILAGKAELPENFKEIENSMFWKNKDLANKIFDFLKVNRQEIVNRQTEPDLLGLKNEILWIGGTERESKQDSWVVQNSYWFQPTNVGTSARNKVKEEGNDQPNEENGEIKDKETVAAWVATSAAASYGAYKIKQLAEKNDIEKVVKNLDDEQITRTIEGAIDTMKKQKETLQSRLTPHQLNTLEKHINELEKWLSDVEEWGVSELIKDWYDIREHLPGTLLKNSFDENLLKQIDKLSDQFPGKTVDDIKTILRRNWITKFDESLDPLLKWISEAKNAKQIRQMTKVIRWWSTITKIAKTLTYALRVDFALSWVDVWAYLDAKKEAELISKINKIQGENMHNQATFHLCTWLWSFLLEWLIVLWTCAGYWSSGWPVWTIIWLAVWVATWGVDIAWDALYFDVRNFYMQNDENYLRQSRWKIKQSILQWIHNYKMWDSSINERFTTWWTSNVTIDEDLNQWSNTKEASLESACRSMIFLEEIEDGTDELKHNSYLLDYIISKKTKDDFLKDKDEEYKSYFNKYREQMTTRIDKRMEYVKKELDKSDIINSIYAGAWAQRLTQIFTESKGYVNMLGDNKRNDSKTYQENLQTYKEDLLKNFPHEKIEKLESIRENNQSLFLDIITTTQLETFLWDEVTDENYRSNVELVETYKKFMSMFENLEDKHYLNIDEEERNGYFIHNVLKADFEVDWVEYPTMKSDNQLLNIVWSWRERRGLTEISDNILQNILYKLARKLNGYSWMNDMYELMQFYNEWEDASNWIYFSSKRKVNQDWAIDPTMINNIPKVLHERDIDRYVENFLKRNFYKAHDDRSGTSVKYEQKSIIDTNTESIDDQLTLELVSVIEGIIREELKNHTVENQNKIKEQIKTVIKENSKWEFMELPYYLILEAKKAWLWDLQRQFFKWNQSNNVIEICYMNKEYNTTSIFGDDCEKLYISSARNEFTETEKSYIDRVDAVCKKLREIKSIEWLWLTQSTRHEDELDLPVEIEHIISDKMIEREKFKDTILLYDANTCNTAEVIRKYTEYAEYFECLYRWILISEAWFSISNDLDSFEYFQSTMTLWSINLFTNEWKIDINAIKESKRWWFSFLLNDNEFISFYNNLYENFEFNVEGGKPESLRYRWNNWNASQKQLAKRISYDIITTTFEKCLLLTDGYWKVDIISKGFMERRKDLKDDIKSEVKEHIKGMKAISDIDIDEIKPLMHEKEIKNLTEWEKQVTDLTPIINELIKERLPQVDWSDRRLQLQYDKENSSINSWWEETKISIEEARNGTKEKITINGLDIEFTDLKEWIRTANLINWLKYNMKKEPIWKKAPNRLHPDANFGKYKRESGSLIREVNNDSNDIEILTENIIDEWHPTIKGSNEFLRFINQLLEFITSDNWSFENSDEGREQWDEEQSVPTDIVSSEGEE